MSDSEINEAVARKLGWRVIDLPSGNGKIRGMTKSDSSLEFLGSVIQLPDYCTSIAVAWEVVEKIKSDGCLFMIANDQVEKRWHCKIMAGQWESNDYADTAARAVCLAFLKLGDK